MILPIYAYGHPILKKVAAPITPDYPDLAELLQNMEETMRNAEGVGLAAPQIGLSIRVFIIDTQEIERKEQHPDDKPLKMVFINAEILETSGPMQDYEEGCLSIPRIRGDVERPSTIRIRWVDENFTPQETSFSGINARVIQHEYDHIEGILFTERLKPLKKRLIQRKLENIRLGKIPFDYKMKFYPTR